MKKLTVNQKEFEKQVKRLTRYVRAYENKGLVFITPIIPERPKRVTKQRIEVLRRIKPTDIARKAYEVDKTTGLVTPYLEPDVRKARRTAKAEFPTGGKIAEPKVKLSEEEKHKRRVEGAKKAAETRRQHELADPIYKARMDEVRRKNLEKARYALEQKRLKKGFEKIFGKPDDDTPIEKLALPPVGNSALDVRRAFRVSGFMSGISSPVVLSTSYAFFAISLGFICLSVSMRCFVILLGFSGIMEFINTKPLFSYVLTTLVRRFTCFSNSF